MAEEVQNVSIQELRAIIQGLKLSGLSFVEEDALEDIRFMINDLPSAEYLDSVAGDPDTRKEIARAVGEIMQLIEQYSKRNNEYKARFESKRKMPTRYKPAETKTIKFKPEERRPEMQQAAKVVEGFVKLSSKFDNVGQGEISSDLIICAQKAMNNSLSKEDVNAIDTKMAKAGFYADDAIFQEAAIGDWWAGVKGGVKGLGQGIKNQYHQFADPAKTNAMFAKSTKWLENTQQNLQGLEQTLSEAQNYVYNQGMKDAIGQMLTQIQRISNEAAQVSSSLGEINTQLQQTTVSTEEQAAQGQEQAAQGQMAPAATQNPLDIDMSQLGSIDDATLESTLEDYRQKTQALSQEKGNRTKARQAQEQTAGVPQATTPVGQPA